MVRKLPDFSVFDALDLEVDAELTVDILDKAYRKAWRHCHPDKARFRDASAVNAFPSWLQINAARDWLVDPVRGGISRGALLQSRNAFPVRSDPKPFNPKLKVGDPGVFNLAGNQYPRTSASNNNVGNNGANDEARPGGTAEHPVDISDDEEEARPEHATPRPANSGGRRNTGADGSAQSPVDISDDDAPTGTAQSPMDISDDDGSPAPGRVPTRSTTARRPRPRTANADGRAATPRAAPHGRRRASRPQSSPGPAYQTTPRADRPGGSSPPVARGRSTDTRQAAVTNPPTGSLYVGWPIEAWLRDEKRRPVVMASFSRDGRLMYRAKAVNEDGHPVDLEDRHPVPSITFKKIALRPRFNHVGDGEAMRDEVLRVLRNGGDQASRNLMRHA